MNTSLYKTVVTKHRTAKWQTQYGSVSIRKKSDGRYHVFLDDYENDKQIRSDFATLRGAETMATNLVESYL